MQIFSLPDFEVFKAWRAQARACIAAGLPPDAVTWQRPDANQGLFGVASTERQHEKPSPAQESTLTVPRSFMAMAELACCHSAHDVFDLLYRLLLRVMASPATIDNPADADIVRVTAMNKSVSRDIHEMKAFVRFKEVGVSGMGRRQFASWFEPEHYIVDHVAGFFARRFADMDWVIDTPKGCMSFVNNSLAFRAFVERPPELRDDMDALWRTYYSSIFNPARLKLKAMTAEMPRKYWKNLPEAAVIPELARKAEQRAQSMQAGAPSVEPVALKRFKAPTVVATPMPEQPGSLAELHEAARGCQRCSLCGPATQTVCGEGPSTAKLMFVGEQPGDEEDLTGRPFVGPAGKIFDQALSAAGIERSAVYVTNAVKHFKFAPRGKRRLHQRPDSGEIDHCRWWLAQELRIIRPRLVVAMGATALQALTGDGKAVSLRRGRVSGLPNGAKLLATHHPSAILRQPNEQSAERMKVDFLADFAQIRDLSNLMMTDFEPLLNSNNPPI